MSKKIRMMVWLVLVALVLVPALAFAQDAVSPAAAAGGAGGELVMDEATAASASSWSRSRRLTIALTAGFWSSMRSR